MERVVVTAAIRNALSEPPPLNARLERVPVNPRWAKALANTGEGGAICVARQRIERMGTQFGRRVGDRLAMQKNVCLNNLLCEWDVATKKEPLLLAAVAWEWFRMLDLPEDKALPPPTVACAREHPVVAIRLLADLKKEDPNVRVSPSRLVDRVALANGWWEEGSEKRADVLVLSRVEEALAEEEWTTRERIHVEGMGDGEVQETLSRLVDRDEIVVPRVGVEAAITLSDVLRTCAEVHDLLLGMREARTPPWEVSAPPSLTEEQRAVFDRVAGGGALTLLCSPAGTGKTHTAACLATACRSRRVLVLAPTHKALAVLRAKLGPEREGCLEYATVQRFYFLCMNDKVPAVDLLLVDEASMLTMRHLRTILRAYRHPIETVVDGAIRGRHARLLLMGDDAQLPCIGRGFPIRDLALRCTTLRLTVPMRAEGRELVRAAVAVREGRGLEEGDGEEVSLVETVAPLLHVEALSAAMRERMGEARAAAPPSPWEEGGVQVITPRNEERKKVNSLFQTALTRTALPPFSDCFVGDPVRLTANTGSYKRGEEGTLLRVPAPGWRRRRGEGEEEEWKATVRLKEGRTVLVEEWHMDPAYASTVHSVQGSEYPFVLLLLPNGLGERMRTRELVYTSITRARRRLEAVGATWYLSSPPPTKRRRILDSVEGVLNRLGGDVVDRPHASSEDVGGHQAVREEADHADEVVG